jgi:selenocysteine lyase/cysteine desulfurase
MNASLPQWRLDTLGVDDHVHLNNAGASLMPACVLRAITDHVELESRVGGYEAAAIREPSISEAYGAVATLLNAKPRNIAFTQSATTAYAQALSAIPFDRGDTLLTTRHDYVSNQLQFLSLRRRFGIELIRAPDSRAGGVDVDVLAQLIHRHRPKLVSVTHVPTNSGLVQDVAAIGAACREARALYLVDCSQSAGQIPLDVSLIGCDFLAVTFRKFMRGPRGVGCLFVSDSALERGLAPLFIDIRGAEWLDADSYRPAETAIRFETFESSPALVQGAGAAARYALQVGLPVISARVLALATRLRAALANLPGNRSLDHGSHLSGIVSLAFHGVDHRAVVERMRQRGIAVGVQLRRVAVIDYDGKGVTSSIRISPHYYNSEDEIDLAAQVLGGLVSEARI